MRGLKVHYVPWEKSLHIWACLALFLAAGADSKAQGVFPKSLDTTPGVHVRAEDGRTHRGSDHYSGLCRVVLQEFGIPADTPITIDLVFIDRETRDRLHDNNATRFESSDWCGAFIAPSLILMVGEEESDDTFMHEFMHYLQQKGLLFSTVPFSAVHPLIERNEGLLLGSKSYLEFLKTR